MVALRTKFDGERIEVPAELRGVAPGEILVVYLSDALAPNVTAAARPSIWEAFGKVAHPRSAEDILAEAKVERDSWDGR